MIRHYCTVSSATPCPCSFASGRRPGLPCFAPPAGSELRGSASRWASCCRQEPSEAGLYSTVGAGMVTTNFHPNAEEDVVPPISTRAGAHMTVAVSAAALARTRGGCPTKTAPVQALATTTSTMVPNSVTADSETEGLAVVVSAGQRVVKLVAGGRQRMITVVPMCLALRNYVAIAMKRAQTRTPT